MHVREDFLHYLWRFRYFDHRDLCSSRGQLIEILHPGHLNKHDGPDFFNAKIKIGDTLWAGHVEIHIMASDWLKHQHQNDSAYNNVILHVVLEEDQSIFRSNGKEIPCLELKKRIPPNVYSLYKQLLHHSNWIPCQQHFPEIPAFKKKMWLDRISVERIANKTKAFEGRLEKNQFNWEETFFQFLSRSFGVPHNSEPFDLLAQSLDYTLLLRHRSSLLQIEALLFGQAGFLDKNLIDPYPRKLKKEYSFLQKKYQLIPLKRESWKFMRLRPANFPTIRIAQLSTLLYQSEALFSKVLAAAYLEEIENMFEVKLSNYWQYHYRFDKASIKRNKTLGKNTIHLFLINTIVPFLFLYGQRRGEERYKEKALKLLEDTPPEQNRIISEWEALGYSAKSASETQALIQLKQGYCDFKRCTECSIGNAILGGT